MSDYKFERISIEHGLSQSTVYDIIQDKEGFMWFGTEEGLNRFDGYNFTIYKSSYKNSFSIANHHIKNIYEDNEGYIWIGTLNGYIIKYDKQNELFYNFKTDSEEEKIKSELASIVEDKSGNLWLGTFHGGLKKFNKISNQFEKLSLSNNSLIDLRLKDVSSLYFGSDERFWIGTWDKGLYLYESKKDKLNHFTSDSKEGKKINHNRIRFIFEDSKKNIWIGTNDGLNLFDPVMKNFCSYLDRSYGKSKFEITTVCEDKNNVIWIGTKTKGLIKMNTDGKFSHFKNESLDQFSLSNDTVYSLCVDKSNVLWIGTSGGGINKLDCERKKFFTINKSYENSEPVYFNSISALLIDSEALIWTGTFNKGLYISKDNQILKFEGYEKFSRENKSDIITQIVEDNNKNIWISNLSKNAVFKFCRSTNSFENINHPNIEEGVNSILLHKNFLWIATRDKSLLKFNISEEKFTDFSSDEEIFKNFSKDMIFSLYMDRFNYLWIGTIDEGLFMYNANSNFTKNYKFDSSNDESISDNCILCITEDQYGSIIIGTNGGGFNYYDRQKEKFTRYTMANGLPNNMVKGIIEDELQNLWISTNKGISKFNSQNKSFRNYEETDGLQSNEFNDGAYFKGKDGTIYFGGINGVTYFKPEEIKDNAYIPNVVLTDFEIFNEPVTGSPENPFLKKNITYADEINLTYKESVFSFRFAALIFNNPQKNQYAYKMEGFDKDWTYCGDRKRVTYTNLNPGEYTFRVKGSNNDSVWNEKGTSIKITISPPYWKTWWFKSLGFLGVIAATGYQYRQRLEKLEKESKAQEEFSRKLIESQENERKRIAHSLHDTIAHEVTISKNKAMMALKHKDNPEFMQKALEEISEMASSTITDVRNISYDLHPHQLERLGFTKAIRSIVNDVSKSTNIKFGFETDNVDEILSKESEINLFRVIQESITNIIKHSMATEATLRVSKLEDYLLIVIVDNGKGFDVNSKEFVEAKHGFGIEGILERVKFMNGEIKVESEINKGTTLRFKIPIKK